MKFLRSSLSKLLLFKISIFEYHNNMVIVSYDLSTKSTKDHSLWLKTFFDRRVAVAKTPSLDAARIVHCPRKDPRVMVAAVQVIGHKRREPYKTNLTELILRFDSPTVSNVTLLWTQFPLKMSLRPTTISTFKITLTWSRHCQKFYQI